MLNQRSWGPLHRAFPRAPSVGCGLPYHIWSLAVWNSAGNYFGGFPSAPSVGCGLPYHISSLTLWKSAGNCFGTPNSTELNNNSTPTRSPTGSLKSDVWSSSSGNNCHAVQRLLSSSAWLKWHNGTFTLSHIISLNPPTRSLSITGRWNVSLPSGVLPWNSIFGLGRRSKYNNMIWKMFNIINIILFYRDIFRLN